MYGDFIGLSYSSDCCQGGGGVAGAMDLGLMALYEQACGDFSSYICWINGDF